MSTPLAKLVDQTATLEGKAENAKAGAIVMIENQPVYIRGLDGWPDDLHRKQVKVTGTLRHKKMIPDPESEPISAGAFGMQWVLEDAKWSAK